VDSNWNKPAFCREFDCPIFTTINDTHTSEWETRVYSGGTFVRTVVQGRSLSLAEWIGYHRLFRYINGHNDRNERISMTVPILTKVKPGLAKNHYIVHFFLPYALQSSAPLPLAGSHVELVEYKGEFKVAVKTFGGYGWNIMDELEELQDGLDHYNIHYNPHSWFFAGYNSPVDVFNRHNEVWLQLTDKSHHNNHRDENRLERWRKLREKALEEVNSFRENLEESAMQTPLFKLLRDQWN